MAARFRTRRAGSEHATHVLCAVLWRGPHPQRYGDHHTPTLRNDETRQRVSKGRVGRLGTIGADGRPHLVPITYAVVGDTLYSAVDDKPKVSRRLRRVQNIERDPQVTVLIDHYEEDWTRLWWCRLEGRARILHSGDEFERALDVLTERYEQYRKARARGPVLAIDVERWIGWSSS